MISAKKRRGRGFGVACLVGAAVCCTGTAAWAQVTGLQLSSQTFDGWSSGPTAYQYWVNHADCVEDVTLSFPLTFVSDSSGGALSGEVQLWKGSNCEMAVSRTNGTCVEVKAALANAQSIELEFKASALMESLKIVGCKAQNFTAEAIPLSFIYFATLADEGKDATIFVLWAKTSVDLLAPTPPAIKLKAGEGGLSFEFVKGLSDAASKDTAKVWMYWDPPRPDSLAGSGCDCGGTPGASTSGGGSGGGTAMKVLPPAWGAQGGGNAVGGGAGVAGAGGAGVAGAGGAGAGSASSSTSSVVGAGAGGAGGASGGGASGGSGGTGGGSALACGEPGGESTRCDEPELAASCAEATKTGGTIDTLRNGTEYRVAVAIEDIAGNLSPLSDVVCASPEEATDFYEEYRARGGQAGGGHCAVRQARSPSSLTAPWFGGATVIVFALRRLSRRSRTRQALSRTPGQEQTR